MVDKLDTGHDDMLSARELYVAVHHSEMGIRRLASRLVVKHDSESLMRQNLYRVV